MLDEYNEKNPKRTEGKIDEFTESCQEYSLR